MRHLASILLVVAIFGLVSCKKIIYVERTSCLSCHQPVQPDGSTHGIEQAHPEVNGTSLVCVDCHGGNPEARKQSEAHVSPGLNAASFIKNLTIGELDDVSQEYLQFVNPGDLRVAQSSCGSGAGSNCHAGIIERVKTNQMATFSGELGVARYRAGMQHSGASEKAIYDLRDPNFIFGQVPGTVGALEKMTEPRVHASETDIGPYQDLYLTKACMRCHLWSFGDNKFPGDFRSSGCTACHMTYANDGLSASDDPTIDKSAPPHPKQHKLTVKIPTEQCMHCHYRGGRIGPSFMGIREGAGPGHNPERAGFLGEALHGHDANYYITDEDLGNAYDETPADVHFRAGMHCIDCHTEIDVHGDGHIYNDTNMAVEIVCEDCHGTADAKTDRITARGNTLENLSEDAEGVIWLEGKIDGKLRRVPQLHSALLNADAESYVHLSMGRDENGFSHLDSLSCDTCHSGWMPNCYGCHVEVNMQTVQRSLISGNSTPGKIRGSRKWVATDDLILMHNTDGKITPSMPSEKMFFTAINGAGETVVDHAPRTTLDGEVGHGQRAFHPHTTQRWSPFMRCERCHLLSGGQNTELLDVVMGFGSDRYMEEDGEGTLWPLDRIQPTQSLPMVAVGHNEPYPSAPLSQETIDKMLAVIVESVDCPVPENATAPFRLVQEHILTPSCATSTCHDSASAKGGLDLSADTSFANLVGQASTGNSERQLVVPGAPEHSYLLHKLVAGGDMVGELMPPSGEKLNECYLNMIRSWIRSGASQ